MEATLKDAKLSPAPILVFEDNRFDMDLVLRALATRRQSNPVQVERDGEAIHAWLARWEAGHAMPLYILLDLHVPRLDGLALLQVLRANSVASRVPVVVMTSSAREGDAEAVHRAGANSFVVKPIEAERFLRLVADVDHYWANVNQLR